MRRSFILATVVVAVAGLVQPVVVAAAPSAMAAFADAGRRAQRSGQAVEVIEQTTATRRVVANPNGTFTLTANRRAAAPDQTNALAVPDSNIWVGGMYRNYLGVPRLRRYQPTTTPAIAAVEFVDIPLTPPAP